MNLDIPMRLALPEKDRPPLGIIHETPASCAFINEPRAD
jgi:hypothetical protein